MTKAVKHSNQLQINKQLTNSIFLKFLLPSIFALMASNLSTMIDTIIVGQTYGEAGLAAMSIVSPVYLVYFTFGSMIAVGSSIITSTYIGRKEYEKAVCAYRTSFVMAITIGIMISVLGILFLHPLLEVLGAKGSLYDNARSYCLFYISGGTCTLLFYIPFNFVRIMGKPKYSMVLLMVMGVLNISLTLFLLRVVKMGLGGASLATVISLFVAFVIGMIMLRQGRYQKKVAFRILPTKEFKQLIQVGSAAAFNNLSRVFVIYGINFMIGLYGTQAALSVYTVSRNINDLFLIVILGISQAVVPIVSMFVGEHGYRQIRLVMKKALLVGNIIIVSCSAIVIVFSRQLIHLFLAKAPSQIDDREIVFAVVCVAFCLNLSFINTLFSNYYSAIYRPLLSNLILLCRTLFSVVIAFTLARFMGIHYLWITFPLSEFVTLLAWNGVVVLISKNRATIGRFTPFWLTKIEKNKNVQTMEFSILNTKEEISCAVKQLSAFCEKMTPESAKTGQVGAALGEIMTLIIDKSLPQKKSVYSDIKLRIDENVMILTIRYRGKRFNPVDYIKELGNASEADKIMDVRLLLGEVKKVVYNELLGVNNITIIL